MIYYFTPYSTEKNLGKYYNDCMAMIPDGSWACFTDGDAMFTTVNFGHQLEEVILQNPEYSLFTCLTNRVGTIYQTVEGVWGDNDIYRHRMLGDYLQRDNDVQVEDITNNPPLSGVLMLLNKKAWFNSDRFKEGGMLGIDNSIHRSIKNSGGKVGLMLGVYLFHWYRGGDRKNSSHLK